ncbi:MAG TPA: ABC transporter substrate-binding protein [Stellaceae bacterium]|nr:ABC transporter substrate-binding protein [Stellaceae bacterium]
MTTRREVLKGAAAAGAVLGFPALVPPARAADEIVFTTPQAFDPAFIDIMNAYSGGHFAKEGLSAKVVGPPGSAASLELVLGGQAQFGYLSSPDLIRAVAARHAPLVAIATIGQRIGFRIVSLPEHPVRTGADLVGKTIGAISVGGLSEDLIDITMIKAGKKPAESKRVVAGNSPGEIELIRQGRIDCFICNFPTAFTLERMGEKIVLLDIDKVIPAPGALYYTTRDMVAKKPDMVQRTLKALKASVDELIAGPDGPIFQRAAKDFDIPRIKDLDTLVALEEAYAQQIWLAEGKETLLHNVPSLWASGVAGMREAGIIDATDPTAFYTNRFVDGLAKS